MAQPPQRGWRRLAYTERTMNYPRIRQKIPVAVYNNLTAMSDAEAPDMGGKLQVYRLEKRKGEVDDANIIAGKRVRPQGPAPIVSAAPRTVAPRRVSPKKAAPSPDVPAGQMMMVCLGTCFGLIYRLET